MEKIFFTKQFVITKKSKPLYKLYIVYNINKQSQKCDGKYKLYTLDDVLLESFNIEHYIIDFKNKNNIYNLLPPMHTYINNAIATVRMQVDDFFKYIFNELLIEYGF